jgi:hypothetical protein
MKKDTLSRGKLMLAGLLFVGAMAYAGFSTLFSSSPMAQLQQGPLSLQVDVFQQLTGTSCGEAVITMVYNYAYPETPVREQEVIDYAIAQGYYTANLPPYTSPSDMVRIAKYYAEDVSTGTVITPDQGLALLVENLQNGNPVIIDVLTRFNDPQSEAHFVVVTGIAMDPNRENAIVVSYNDPLTGRRESADWLGEHGVWNAWQNNGDPGGSGWWLVISS